MKNQKYLILAAAGMLFTACSNDENGVNEPTPIRLGSSLTVQETRAATGIQTSAFLADEKVEVFIDEYVVSGGTTVSNGYTSPLTYTTGSNGTLTPASTQPYYPTSGNGVNIHAFYPSGTVTAFNETAVDFTVKTNQSTDAGYKASDLMYGAPPSNPVARTENAVLLTFKHLLAKVTVALKEGVGSPSLDGAKVELLGVLPTVGFTPSTQTLGTAKGTAAAVTVMTATATSLSGSAVIVPQTLAAQFVRVTLKDGGVLIGKLDDGTAPVLKSGYEHKYDITVSLSTLSISGTIAPWNELTSQNGTATLQ